MLNNFFIAGEQVGIVFVLLSIGFFAGKRGIINDSAADSIADIIIKIIMPAVIIMAFQREFEARLIKDFAHSFIYSLLYYVIGLAVASLTVREKETKKRTVLICAAVFSNCSMMALPMQAALFGADGVFCGAAHLAAFNMIFWPYCDFTMSNERDNKAFRRIFMNPCMISAVIGILLFLCKIDLPVLADKTFTQMSNVNLPLCMLALGQRLSRKPVRTLLNKKYLMALTDKLLLLPLLMLTLMLVFHESKVVAISAVIAMASPSAASVGMVSMTYNQDSELGAGIVSVCTMLSLVTMPIIIGIANCLY